MFLLKFGPLIGSTAQESSDDEGWVSHESSKGLRTPKADSDSDAGWASVGTPRSQSSQHSVSHGENEVAEILDGGRESMDDADAPAPPPRNLGGRPRHMPRAEPPRAPAEPAVIVLQSGLVSFDRGSARFVFMEGRLANASFCKQTADMAIAALGIAEPKPFEEDDSGKALNHILNIRLESERPLRGTTWTADAAAARIFASGDTAHGCTQGHARHSGWRLGWSFTCVLQPV